MPRSGLLMTFQKKCLESQSGEGLGDEWEENLVGGRPGKGLRMVGFQGEEKPLLGCVSASEAYRQSRRRAFPWDGTATRKLRAPLFNYQASELRNKPSDCNPIKNSTFAASVPSRYLPFSRCTLGRKKAAAGAWKPPWLPGWRLLTTERDGKAGNTPKQDSVFQLKSFKIVYICMRHTH